MWHAMPVVLALPFCLLFWQRNGERWFWRLALAALQAHGPLSVKFAQWASTRPDILPPRICAHFAELQDAVRPHSFRGTARALEDSFGPGWGEALRLESEPIGSGCMAQVYRGHLSVEPGVEREVALKVRHPGAQEKVDLDLDIMWRMVRTLEALWPSARYLAMSEALAHFEAFVRPQADLRIEAANLEHFRQNFNYDETGRGLRVRFPKVVRPYVSESVLVESFESAAPLQAVLGQIQAHVDATTTETKSCAGLSGVPEGIPMDEIRERVGKLCMDMFLKMLFRDNFIHGDLHPGNIHFSFTQDHRTGASEPELVIFDAGIAVRLTPRDRQNFVEVFHAISTDNGRQAGQLMLERSPGDHSRVVNPDGFVTGVGELIHNLRSDGIELGKVRLGSIFQRMINLAVDHRVKLETSFVTIATSIIVIEGVGRQLNPVVDLILAARPLLVEAFTKKLW